MKTYAYIVDAVVQEVIPPQVWDAEHPDRQEGEPSRIGLEIPLSERRTPEYIDLCVEITDLDPMPAYGWIYSGGMFSQPQETGTSPEEILASQSAKLQYLTQLASSQKVALTNRIGTLNDAIELEEATPEEVEELPLRQAQLLNWKRYAIYLGRVTSQAGWPPEVEWPIQPAEGMDLTVSAVAPGSPQLQ